MWVKSLHLKNIKSFADSDEIEFSSGINLLVGPNNAGKSTIIRAISVLQPFQGEPIDAPAFLTRNRRHLAEDCELNINLENPNKRQLRVPPSWVVPEWHPHFWCSSTGKG